MFETKLNPTCLYEIRHVCMQSVRVYMNFMRFVKKEFEIYIAWLNIFFEATEDVPFHLALLSVIPTERSALRSPLSPSVGGRHAWFTFKVIISSIK